MDSVEDSLEYEKALKFLIENLQKSGNNPKPVGIHSVLVGARLYRHGYRKEVVLGGLLHDVVEDTAITVQDVEKEFGREVAKFVDSMSRDTRHLSFDEKYKSFKEHMKELVADDAETLAIAASDFIENAPFYKRGDSNELFRYLKYKYESFLKESKPLLSDSPLWSELEKAYEEHVKNLI